LTNLYANLLTRLHALRSVCDHSIQVDTLKFERDVSLQTEDTVHDNSSQTDQQQWIHQLLIQMNQRLDEIESLTISTENIINVLQILDEMKNELIDIDDDETSELRDVQDRINHLHSQIIQSQCCEELIEMIIRLDDKITMIKFLSLIDENSLFYKKLKSALEKSEAEFQRTASQPTPELDQSQRSTNSTLYRICRYALPFQAGLLVLLGIASMIPLCREEVICSVQNSFRDSLEPMLTWNNGSPPL